MASFTDLPIEIKLEISKLSLTTFNSIIRTDKSFYVYISNHPKILSLIKDHFTVKIDGYETRYELNGKLHREGDLPAIICSYSELHIEEWWKDGKRHREGDLPAIININIDSSRHEWWKDGKPHRDGDFPAYIYIWTGFHRGSHKEWWKDGKRHRDGDLPAFIECDPKGYSSESWWKDGESYRDGDLPTYIYIDADGSRHEKWR